MLKLKTLAITFSEPIKAKELACFRGAICEKIGWNNEWFHNHNNLEKQASGYHLRYPLVQYHRFNGKPQLLFINEAVEEAHHIFVQTDWTLKMADRNYHAKIDELKVKELPLGIREDEQEYRLHHWLALNEKNHKLYQQTHRMTERIQMLERILAGNILSMSKGVNYFFPEKFELYITNMGPSQQVVYKKTKLVALQLDFRINADLPVGLCLGKGGSMGFGRIDRVN